MRISFASFGRMVNRVAVLSSTWTLLIGVLSSMLLSARYAESGFTCFLPDLYWRMGRVRFAPHRSKDEPLPQAMHDANTATTVEMSTTDTRSILDYVRAGHARAGVRLGAVGHCMGARHALGALAAFPGMIAFAACLHGGRMVWDGPNAPHLYIPRIRGRAYFAFAADDPTCPDEHKCMIEQTIRASCVRASTEHFSAAHGWTLPERWCYDRVAAERVWTRILDLLKMEVG
jgi:carboxymethylenebutenolidase